MSYYHTVVVRDVHIRGRACGRFPVVAKADGEVLLDVTRYLIYCIAQGDAEAGLITYAAHLRDFYEQLHEDDLAIHAVTLKFLNGYRNEIEKRASRAYAGQVLRTVLAYLYYLECRGAICGVIGETAVFQVTITRTRSGGISHSLMADSASPKSNYVPSDKAVETIKRFGPKGPIYLERFELMVDWGHVKGLRAKEVCGLVMAQIPSQQIIDAAFAEDRTLELRLVVTKGGKVRNIEVHPLLLSRTRKWIDADRPKIERAAERRAVSDGRTYVRTDAVFMSSATGGAITPKTFSNLVRSAFKAAVRAGELTVDQRVWAHGLRKVMINREVKSRPSSEYRPSERVVMQEVGHGSLAMLGRYVVDQE